MTYVPITNWKCPFGERDLTRGKEECYYGNGVDMCPYFKEYVYDGKHDDTIACKHPPIERYKQLSLFE